MLCSYCNTLLWPVRAKFVSLLGSTPDALQYSIDYATFILLAFPFTLSNAILNQLHKSEGNASFAMLGTISGCVVNILLDPIFINVFKWEVAGAAAATAISKFISFTVLITPYIKHKTLIHLSYKNIRFVKKDILEVAKIGIPTFLKFSLISFGAVVTNNAAKVYGTTVLAAISIANKVYRLLASGIMGFGQSIGPLTGINYGAKQYNRIKELYLATLKIGFTIGSILGIIIYLNANSLVGLFNHSNNPEILAIGVFKLRFLCIAIIPHVFTIATNQVYQGLGKPIGNLVLGMSRQLLFLIPFVLILPKFYDAYGVAAAQGASDLAAGLLLALPLAILVFKDLSKKEKESK